MAKYPLMSSPPSQSLKPVSLVNLERYALNDLATQQGQRVLANGREEMRRTGCFRLPGFLSPTGLRDITQEARAASNHAHHSDRRFTPYYREPDLGFPASDPRASAVRFAVGYVARDRLPTNGLIQSLFAWDGLLRLVSAILDRGPIHRFDDTLGSLNVTVMLRGEELGWHFDACEAVVSVLLEEAAQGGQFQYIPPFAGTQSERLEQVSAVLNGDHSDAREVAMMPGDFVLFCGRHSLHRVSPVAGGSARMMLLMSFDTVEHRETDNVGNVDLFGRANANALLENRNKRLGSQE